MTARSHAPLPSLSLLVCAAGATGAAAAGARADASNPGGYHPPNTPSSSWTANAVLCYMDGRSLPGSPTFSDTYRWTSDKFKKLYGFQSRDNTTLDFFFDTFLFLGYDWLDGKSFWPGAGGALNATDWEQFQQLQLSAMRELGDAASEVAQELGAGAGCRGQRGEPQVFLSVLAPDPKQQHFGPVQPGGPSLNLSVVGERLVAAKWSVDTAVAAVASQVAGVHLAGFYWFVEDIHGEGAALVASVCEYVHAKHGLKMIWIPYYDAPGGYNFSYWKRDLGFDAVFLQPNFAFHNSSYEERFDAVNATASENYLGVELELPMYVRNPQVHDWATSVHLYLEAGVRWGFMHSAVKAYYEGNSFVDMQLGNATLYGVYQSVYAFVKGTYPNVNIPL